MSDHLSDERIPEDEPWKDRDFLKSAIHDKGLSPRTIAHTLGVSKSRVTVHAERLGILRPWRHEPTLCRLHVEQGLSADEIAAREEFDCTETTVRKYLSRYGLTNEDPNDVTYGRLDKIGETESEPEQADV